MPTGRRRKNDHDIPGNYVGGVFADSSSIYRPVEKDGLRKVPAAAAYRHTNQVTVDD